ncbi:MAG: PaaI family thioesterase [Immundisolibacterales bacterium]|nr:PaaI family thioesterase [Immundisolibacterales bacterium]
MTYPDFSEPASLREWMESIPHQRAIGFELVDIGAGFAVGRIPYRPVLVGNPASGVVHGGIVTTLLDTVGGMAALARQGEFLVMATLDLRIDYLRPSTPGEDLSGRVECYKLTRNVAFTRGFAFNADPDDPLASMSATYMLNTPAARSSPRTHAKP